MRPSLLLLEDDLQLSDTLKQFLVLKGYAVYCAYDGIQAQELLFEHPVDLMLIDVNVPLLNGFELLRQLRTDGNETPAIFITSLNSVDDVARGFHAGCDDYIRKPFALKELLVRIESLLKRSFGTHNHIIPVGKELFFDTKELTLTKNRRRVALKTKELTLLALLLRHPNELLEYDTIFNALWHYDETPNSGSLRTYIKTLRAAIGKEKIETVKNIGYRFVTE